MVCNCYKKSSLDVVNTSGQNLTTGANLSFSTVNQYSGESIEFVAGSSVINISKPGLYMINFDAYAAENGVVGDVTVQLFVNGVAIPGKISSYNSTAVTDFGSLHIFASFEVTSVCPCAGTGSAVVPVIIQNTGVGAIFDNASVTIIKQA